MRGRPKQKRDVKPRKRRNDNYTERRKSEKELAQMQFCLNCPYPECNTGNLKNCAKEAARAKQLQEASGEEAARLRKNAYYREYREKQKEQSL